MGTIRSQVNEEHHGGGGFIRKTSQLRHLCVMSAAPRLFTATFVTEIRGTSGVSVSRRGDRVPPAGRRRGRVAPTDPVFRGFRRPPRRYPAPPDRLLQRARARSFAARVAAPRVWLRAVPRPRGEASRAPRSPGRTCPGGGPARKSARRSDPRSSPRALRSYRGTAPRRPRPFPASARAAPRRIAPARPRHARCEPRTPETPGTGRHTCRPRAAPRARPRTGAWGLSLLRFRTTLSRNQGHRTASAAGRRVPAYAGQLEQK